MKQNIICLEINKLVLVEWWAQMFRKQYFLPTKDFFYWDGVLFAKSVGDSQKICYFLNLNIQILIIKMINRRPYVNNIVVDYKKHRWLQISSVKSILKTSAQQNCMDFTQIACKGLHNKYIL